MSKTLVIVESPAKKNKIQEILGDKYEVLATYGHIADLPTNKLGVDVKNGFAANYILMDDKKEALQAILDSAQRCDKIFLSGDPDNEGEAICYNLLKYLKPFNKPIQRSVFNEITKKAIKKGIANPREVDLNVVGAARCRRILDRLVGFMSSPYLMARYKSPMSAGRVQSAVVKLIVDQEKSIENFKREEYWPITAQFLTKDMGQFTAKFESKVRSKEEADQYVAKIQAEKGFLVISVVAEDRPKAPNPPLITVKLQQIMAKQFGFDAERTQQSAQHLYESGLITYLRTDSVRVSEEAIGPARDWLTSNNFPIPKKATKYEDKHGAQSGHECLRPTNIETSPDSKMISGDDALVYRVIFEHFLASQMTPAIYSTLQIKLAGIKNPELIFKVAGKALKTPGFLAIFGEKKTGVIELPLVSEKEPVKLDKESVKAEQKFTQPPSRYNDATILEDLDAKGIGRPATYANIIKTITARNYVEKQGNTFIPTKLGREITELLEQSFSFVDSNYTSKMEAKLDQIADGKLNCLDMLNEFYDAFKKQLDAAYTKDGHDICTCGGVLFTRKSRTGNEFIGCSNYPNCRITKSIETKENVV